MLSLMSVCLGMSVLRFVIFVVGFAVGTSPDGRPIVTYLCRLSYLSSKSFFGEVPVPVKSSRFVPVKFRFRLHPGNCMFWNSLTSWLATENDSKSPHCVFHTIYILVLQFFVKKSAIKIRENSKNNPGKSGKTALENARTPCDWLL